MDVAGHSAPPGNRPVGRAILVLAASHHYALRGVRPGTRLTRRIERKLHAGRKFHVGGNRWYLASEPGSRGVIKVRGDLIEEIGIADARLTRRRQAARRIFGSFG